MANAVISQTVAEHSGASSLDMAAVLLKAYELGDLVNLSAEVADYLYWKEQVAACEEVQALSRAFGKAREQFAECERFGRYHPDYQEARERVRKLERQLAAHDNVVRYKLAEQAVEQMLFEISSLLGGAVSASVKVPSETGLTGGCGSGGSCGCSSGGCG